MGVDIDVVYEGELHCAATHGPSGKSLDTDAPVDNGGKGESFSPTDLVATAFGACMITIMDLTARDEGREMPSGIRAHVVKEMVADPVRRIGTLRVALTIPGWNAMSPGEQENLREIAGTCPVCKSLHPDINLVVEFGDN
jgi:putative redox protein